MTTTEPEKTMIDTPSGPRPDLILRGLALDVGLPIVVYYALHLLGATDWVALLAASAAAVLRIVWGLVAKRRLNLFATAMLLVYGLSFALAFGTGDPRALLLKGSLITGGLAILFAVTAFGPRPLTLAAMQSFQPARADELAEEFRTEPAARHGHRVSSSVWAGGLAVEALLRLPVIYLLPIPVATGLSEGMLIAAIVLLSVWNAWYVRRLIRRAEGSADPQAAAGE